jgi:hypothetical protein
MKSVAPDSSEPAVRIEQALFVYDNLQTVLKNPIARSKISELLEKINVRLWLSFATNLKGTRQVQVLEQFDISYSVASVLEEALAVGGGYRSDGVGDGLA